MCHRVHEPMNPKPETRNPKQTQCSKLAGFAVGFWTFFGFRASDSGFRTKHSGGIGRMRPLPIRWLSFLFTGFVQTAPGRHLTGFLLFPLECLVSYPLTLWKHAYEWSVAAHSAGVVPDWPKVVDRGRGTVHNHDQDKQVTYDFSV